MAKDVAREVGSVIERLRIEAGVATVCGGGPTRESLLALKEDLNRIVSAGNVALHEVEDYLSYFKEYLRRETGKEVMILGQIHHYLGIK